MKRTISLGLAFLAFVYLSTTAFQCSSADFSSGKLYLGQKNYAKAEESLVREVTKNPGNGDAWLFLGETRFNLNKYMEMREAFNKYDELAAKDPAIRNAEKKSAEEFWLRKAWEKSHNEGIDFYNRYVKDRELAHLDTAVQRFTVGIAMQPDSLVSYYYRAAAYNIQKNEAGQFADLRKIYDRDPSYSEVAKFLGNSYYNYGEEKARAKDSVGAIQMFTSAAECYEKASVVQPGDQQVLANLISSYAQIHQIDRAVKVARQRVDKEPSNKDARYFLGVTLFSQDDFPGAVEQFEKCLEIDPDFIDAHDQLGRAYVNWGKLLQDASEAKAEAERVKNKGKQTKAKEDLSYVDTLLRAIPHLEKAVEVHKDDLRLWQALSQLYQLSKQPEKLKKALEVVDQLSKAK
jgi:tetratricopeptide (TPR) repeat protein